MKHRTRHRNWSEETGPNTTAVGIIVRILYKVLRSLLEDPEVIVFALQARHQPSVKFVDELNDFVAYRNKFFLDFCLKCF